LTVRSARRASPTRCHHQEIAIENAAIGETQAADLAAPLYGDALGVEENVDAQRFQ